MAPPTSPSTIKGTKSGPAQYASEADMAARARRPPATQTISGSRFEASVWCADMRVIRGALGG
jgi:hypothetical protein